MNQVTQFLLSEPINGIPNWAFLAIALAVVLSLVGAAIAVWLSRSRFRKQLRELLAEPEKARGFRRERYGPSALLARSRWIDRFARREDRRIVELLLMDDLWLNRLMEKKRKRDFLRVLHFLPEKGLFQCFLLSLDKPNFASSLLQWLSESQEFLPLRMLALSGKGEEFSGQAAYNLFENRLAEIREMTGDPEWACRYFSLKILLYDQDRRSLRALWEAFEDSHPLIRRTLARELHTEEREKLYGEILKLLLRDPVFEVRKTAWERIHSEFSDLYSLDTGKLSDNDAFHVLELLRVHAKTDEDFALRYLESDRLDLRYSAALFLEKCGTLDRLCLEVDLGDREGLNRNRELLRKAAEVNVSSFLSAFERSSNPATLLTCVSILSRLGHRDRITEAAKKVFRIYDGRPEYQELYQEMLSCISQHGNDDGLRLLDKELHRRRNQETLLEKILPSLPPRGDHIFVSSLLSFFKDPHFPAKPALRETLRRMPVSLVLPEVFEIIKAERSLYQHTVRMEALRLLAELKMPYCLQTILEHLPILPLEEAKSTAAILSEYPRDYFIEKAKALLETTDSKIRATLIACLPATQEREFLKPIRVSLKDADPDVRIACLWALVEYGDTRSLNQSFSMIRDPIERVRVEAAKALGGSGSSEILKRLGEILNDENEVDSVKRAVIQGLGFSKSLSSVDILADHLEQQDGYQAQIQAALAGKRDKNEILHIVECYRDAGPMLRDRLMKVFSSLGEKGEGAMVELLRENIPSLHASITEVLESTGYTAAMVRKLSHRHAHIRREAAEVLSLLGTESAFRGMVLAAQDPDEEVRVKVIRALERLESDSGKAVLASLEKDPDRRVRKYTLWAMERLKSKSL